MNSFERLGDSCVAHSDQVNTSALREDLPLEKIECSKAKELMIIKGNSAIQRLLFIVSKLTLQTKSGR